MRRFLVVLHRWAGLLTAIFLIVVGVTGAVLPFGTDIERLVVPGLFALPAPNAVPLDLATLAERAEAQEPHARVAYFALTDRDRVTVRMQPRINPVTDRPYTLDFDHIFLDPVSGRELGKRHDGDLSQGLVNLMPFILDLHESLALGDSGILILGVIALIWTIDCLIALALTFPLRGDRRFARWSAGFRIKTTTNSFRLNFDLHRGGGLWVWPMLFVFAWSSVMFNLRPVYEGATAAILGFQPELGPDDIRSLTHPNESPKLDWRTAMERGATLMAQQTARAGITVEQPFGLAYIDLFGVYVYDVRASDDVGGRTWESGVWIDADTGKLRRVFRPQGPQAGNTVSTWLYALHMADLRDSRAYRVFVSLLGALTTLLSATGIYIWLTKRRARARRIRAAAAIQS